MRKNAFPDQLEPSEHWRFQRKQEEFLASEFEVGSPKEWPGEHFNLHQDAISQYSDMPKTLKYLTTFRSKETSNNAQVDVVECSSGIYALKRIKRINSGKNNEELEQMNYIKGEVSILRKIHRVNYRHFVKLVASYTDEKYVGILMSPVADCNLATFLDNFHNNGYLNPHLLEGFFGCLASALAYLHYVENIRHKDIKPENILVMGNSVLLTDFGISLDWSASGHTTTSQEKMKTAKYCAPELDKGEPRNSKSDIWSLGCVFLEMFTVLKGRDRNYVDTTLKKNGEPPKFCRSPEIIKDLIAGLKAHNPQCENKPLGWIEKMLQQSHKERPNARILREEILEDRYCGICCQGDKVFQDVSPHQVSVRESTA
ncbi:kinase-like protein [Annulohypoxylon bovei var. microspora]|nr:kinase-like protein [Annulohypoxylon bovei var. microspora]